MGSVEVTSIDPVNLDAGAVCAEVGGPTLDLASEPTSETALIVGAIETPDSLLGGAGARV